MNDEITLDEFLRDNLDELQYAAAKELIDTAIIEARSQSINKLIRKFNTKYERKVFTVGSKSGNTANKVRLELFANIDALINKK